MKARTLAERARSPKAVDAYVSMKTKEESTFASGLEEAVRRGRIYLVGSVAYCVSCAKRDEAPPLLPQAGKIACPRGHVEVQL